MNELELDDPNDWLGFMRRFGQCGQRHVRLTGGQRQHSLGQR